jgi:hypothetical protein
MTEEDLLRGIEDLARDEPQEEDADLQYADLQHIERTP